MAEYFNIPKIPYEGKNSKNPLAFKFYNPDEEINGKKMREHLKFALSWWHTMGGDGTDMFGVGTADKKWGGSDAMDIAKNKAYAAFEIMDKLSVDYYCFHDRDIAPEADNLKETNKRLDEISDLLKELMDKSGKKLLWGTANCFNNPRYMHGAGTAPDADVFAFAAAQIKKALELTVKLGGNGYVFWGGREGYETLLNTNLCLEQDNMARLMHLAVDYARSIGFKGDFYIEPKPKEPTKHQYDFDTATVLGFLRKYDLLNDFKMNIEANHATLAGHTFQHELRVARENGVFGSIDANQGDMLLGWDTDQFPTNILQVWIHSLSVCAWLTSLSRTAGSTSLLMTGMQAGKQALAPMLFPARLNWLILKSMHLKRAMCLLLFPADVRKCLKAFSITFFSLTDLLKFWRSYENAV